MFTGPVEICDPPNTSLHFKFKSTSVTWSLYVQAGYSWECSPSALLSFNLLSFQQGHFITFLMSSVIPSYTRFDAVDFIVVS